MRQRGSKRWKVWPRSLLCHSVTQPGNGTLAPHWSWMPRESVLACRYDHNWPSGPMSVSDSPMGRPASGTSSFQAARPAQKSARVGGGRWVGSAPVRAPALVGSGVAAQVAGGGGGQGGVGGGVGVGVGGGVGVELWAGDGLSASVGLAVAEGLAVGDGLVVAAAVAVAVGVAGSVGEAARVSVGGRAVSVRRAATASTPGSGGTSQAA